MSWCVSSVFLACKADPPPPPVTQPYSSHHHQLSQCGETCFKFQSEWLLLSSCWIFSLFSMTFILFLFSESFADWFRPVPTGSDRFWPVFVWYSWTVLLYQSGVHFLLMCQKHIFKPKQCSVYRVLANISVYVFKYFLLFWAGYQFIASYSLSHQFEPVITRWK